MERRGEGRGGESNKYSVRLAVTGVTGKYVGGEDSERRKKLIAIFTQCYAAFVDRKSP